MPEEISMRFGVLPEEISMRFGVLPEEISMRLENCRTKILKYGKNIWISGIGYIIIVEVYLRAQLFAK